MFKRIKPGFFVVLLLALTVTGMVGASASGPLAPAAPVGTAFTYQGSLTDNGSPANGSYDFFFSPFDAASGGVQVADTQIKDDVAIVDGYFAVTLDFGTGLLEGDARWLEVDVRPGSSTGGYTTLSPRIALSGVPYALSLRPGAVVNTSQANVPAISVGAPNANSNALVATGNANGYAVIYGEDQSAFGGYGMLGRSSTGTGVRGEGDIYGVEGYADGAGVGMWGSSESGTGVLGSGRPGVIGATAATFGSDFGVLGEVTPSNPGPSSAGVMGLNRGTGASGIGVWGEQRGTGYGVYGSTPPGGYGVVGTNGGSNSSGYAGSFNGRVAVTGTLSKGGGSFRIDHPLDPANKYLSHSFVESPDMMNIYNGNVTTDADGFATVTMPDWFEALNQDFRYQLTVIGQFAQAIVAEEIKENQFRIQTDQPGVKVSWQVTGIRHDPFAEAYRIPVEEEKTGGERGRYLYPDVYGKTVQESIWYASSPNVRYMIDHPEARERLDADARLPDPASLEQPPGQ